MFFRLNRLVQTIRIPPSGHNTPRKLIDNQNFIILHHIVLIAVHQVICPQSQDNIVLNLQILRVGKIFNMEEILHLLYTLLS